MLILNGTILDASERLAQFLHHRAALGVAAGEDDRLVGAVDLVVDLAHRGDDGCGTAHAALGELARGDLGPLHRALVHASFVVDTLMYLYRGGRCNAVAAMAGSVLKLHPKIVVENGAMDAAKKYRGKLHSVVMSYVRDMEADLKNARPERVFITHSGCDRKIVEDVQAYLQSLGIFQEILETRAGGVVSSHCGPGTLGVLFIAK